MLRDTLIVGDFSTEVQSYLLYSSLTQSSRFCWGSFAGEKSLPQAARPADPLRSGGWMVCAIKRICFGSSTERVVSGYYNRERRRGPWPMADATVSVPNKTALRRATFIATPHPSLSTHNRGRASDLLTPTVFNNTVAMRFASFRRRASWAPSQG